MFEARFQTFDDPQRARGERRRASRRCAPSSSGAGSTASSCRAPTAIRTNTCRPARSGWPGSPASPARPAPPIVLADRAALFVDGRYTLQARDAGRHDDLRHRASGRDAAGAMARAESAGAAPSSATTRGCTPPRAPRSCAKACANGRRRRWCAVDAQSDRRALDATARRRRSAPVTLHDLRFAGESAADKLERIRAEIAKLRADALVVSDPHDVAWTFNIRGADVAHTPLPLAFAIVPREGRPALYVDGAQAQQRGAPRARRARRRARARRLHRATSPRSAAGKHRAARPGDRAPTRSRAS